MEINFDKIKKYIIFLKSILLVTALLMWQKINQADNVDTQRGSFNFTENLIVPVEYFKAFLVGIKQVTIL